MIRKPSRGQALCGEKAILEKALLLLRYVNRKGSLKGKILLGISGLL